MEKETRNLSSSERGLWKNKSEFLLACVGYAVGLGNIWRFPYLCFKSGGGAFLIPYLTMLILCGIPLLYMEMAVGQFTRFGPVQAIGKLCPLMKGVGAATVVISFVLCTYYNVIITWALYYLFHSFQSTLPWYSCNETWSSNMCGRTLNITNSTSNSTLKPVSSTQDFFDRKVLNKTSGIDDMGSMQWDVFGCFILAWVLCYLCVFKGIKSAGKIQNEASRRSFGGKKLFTFIRIQNVYVPLFFFWRELAGRFIAVMVVYLTATFPYVVLVILLISGAMLPGAGDGVYYFLKPVWSELANVHVWVNAAAQNFNSIGIGFGSLIAFSSYNRRNNNILTDTLTIACINSATSLLAGFVIFSALGHMAHVLGQKVEDVVTEGPELVFIVYPQIFANLPATPVWAVLFFFMLVCLGIDSQFAMIEVVNTSLSDMLGGRLLTDFFKRKEFLSLAVCAVAFLIGIPNLMQGGIYVFTLLDSYTAVVALVFLAFFEIVTVCWVYGGMRLANNVREMTGNRPSWYFIVCWLVFAPVLVGIILLFSIIQYKPASYGKYSYPPWADGIGWLIALCSMLCIPIGVFVTMITSQEDTLWQRLMVALKPVVESGNIAVTESKAMESVTSSNDNSSNSPPPNYFAATGENSPFMSQL